MTTWARPSDFAEWSDSFYIIVKLQGGNGSANYDDLLGVTLHSDVTQYTWTGLLPGYQYLVWVQYCNDAGLGVPCQSINYVMPKCLPDAPVAPSVVAGDSSAVLSWYPAAFFGQTALVIFKLYKNDVFMANVSPQTTSFQVPGLVNGFSYDFKVTAVNAIGESLASAVVTAAPFAQMSIVSCVAAGKTLTITLSPQGNPIQGVTILALDQDPSSDELSSCLVTIPQNEINPAVSGNIQVVKIFSAFSSNLAFYAVVAHNSVNSAQQQSSSLASA